MIRLVATTTLVVLLALAPASRADVPSSGEAAAAPAPAQGAVTADDNSPVGHIMAHLSLGVPLQTWLASTGNGKGAAAASQFGPDTRFVLADQIGVGWWFLRNFRLQLTFQFNETLSGTEPGGNALTLAGAIPWVVYTNGIFFGGVGALLAPRSYGIGNFDAGIYPCTGVSFPVGGGISVGAALQAPVMLDVRTAFSIAPAVFVAQRF